MSASPAFAAAKGEPVGPGDGINAPVHAGDGVPNQDQGIHGPGSGASNSGDGISDGPGW